MPSLWTRAPLLPPSPGPYPPKEGTISFQFVCPEGSRFRAFLHGPPSGHPQPLPLSPQPPLPPRWPPPFISGDAPPSVLPPARPRPQGRLAPQATPAALGWLGGREAREGRAAAGGVSSSVRGGDWLGRGEGAGLLPVSQGSPGRLRAFFAAATSGSGDFDARVATLVRAACLTSGQQWTPSSAASRFLRVSPCPWRGPWGRPPSPSSPFRKSPNPKPQEYLRGSIAE